MEKKTLFITGGVAITVAAALLIWRAVSLNGNAESLAGGVFAEPQGDHLVPRNEIYSLGLDAEQLPPLNQPTMTSVRAADMLLADELYGIAIEVNGTHRFYPVQVLNWHGVVNEIVQGTRLAITYDLLTGSAGVFETGQRQLKISGKVYNNNALLEDDEGNLWYQIRGQMVVGDDAGATFPLYPFQMYRWGDWKTEYPNGDVLGFDTGYEREYRRHPYGAYEISEEIFFPLNYVATPMPIKWVIDGVVINNEAAAFARKEMATDRVAAATVGGIPVVAFYDDEREVTHVFRAAIGEQTLTFVYDEDKDVYVDQETNSTWDVRGFGRTGEYKDQRLEELTAPEAYWFAWAAAYPNTTYPGIDAEDAPKAK